MALPKSPAEDEHALVSQRPRRQPALATARIVERCDHTHDLWSIKLQPSVPFTFKPGQYCTIGYGGIERPYSIVSAPEEPLIELFIEAVPEPEGQLTPLLHRLQPGDEVTLRPTAKGIFVLDATARTHVMVATVTGIAPYISILRHNLASGKVDYAFHVLMGGSFQEELVYSDELRQMAAAHPESVWFTPTVSRPHDPRNVGWTGRTGRVNALVEDYLRERGIGRDGTLVYACGHPGMIEDVKARMGHAGYRFREERFWKE